MTLASIDATPVKGDARIVVSHRALRYYSEKHGTHLFPIGNVSHFGDGRLEIFHIPWSLIPIVFVLWQTVVIGITVVMVLVAAGEEGPEAADGMLSAGIFFGFVGFAVCTAGVIWNLVKPTWKGLLLILASGDRHLFVSRNLDRIRAITDQMSSVIETLDSGQTGDVYAISIEGGNVVGSNLIVGDVVGNARAAANSAPAMAPLRTPPPPPPPRANQQELA